MMSDLELFADRARDAGAEGALRDPADVEWAESATKIVEHLAAAGVEFTADDVRRRAGEPPSPAAVGAVLLAAARRRLIERVGFRRSRRIQRRSGYVTVWRVRR